MKTSKKIHIFLSFIILIIFITYKNAVHDALRLMTSVEPTKEAFQNSSRLIYESNIDTEKAINIQQNDLNDYKKLHGKIMKGVSPLKILINRSPQDVGYANKLYSFLSSLLSAILTDSALVVMWPGINQFIEEPL